MESDRLRESISKIISAGDGPSSQFITEKCENQENLDKIFGIIREMLKTEAISGPCLDLIDCIKYPLAQGDFSSFCMLTPKDNLDPLKYMPIFTRMFQIFPEFPSNMYTDVLSMMDSAVVSKPFDEFKGPLLKLLIAAIPNAPTSFALHSGLFDSILLIFLRDPASFENSITFLELFFQRTDAKQLLSEVVFTFIVGISHFSPYPPHLWRFLCSFFERFCSTIEDMTDFDSLEPSGLLPVFTRSLIWDIRCIYENPPEKSHEECYWKLILSIFQRLSEGNQQSQRLFTPLLGGIRLSVFWSAKSALIGGNFESKTVVDAWCLLLRLGSAEMAQLISSQPSGEALNAALMLNTVCAQQKEC